MVNKAWFFPAIFAMTFCDIAFTAIGLKLGVIEEANPVMDYFIKFSLPLTMVVAFILTSGLLLLLFKFRYRIKWLPSALICIMGIKVWIMFSHFRWLVLFMEQALAEAL